jgi:hypothetical protein
MVGLYNYVDGARLPITDAGGNNLGDALELTHITLEP